MSTADHNTGPENADKQYSIFTEVWVRFAIVLAIVLLAIGFSEGATVQVATVTVTLQPTPTLPPTVTPTPEPTATSTPTATPSPTATATQAPTDTPVPAPTDAVETGGSSYAPELVASGEALFASCAACHGPDGRGLPNLGKDLVASEFVAGLTDQELLQFIIMGRPIWDPLNTTGVDMPGKGGNPALTSEDILAIIAYVRSLADEPSEETAAPSSGEAAYAPELVASGEALFASCAACHGPDGRGLPNLGKDLVASEFVAGLTDQELLQFIIMGRPIWDPLNTTGVDMPGKGGNPALTSEDILAIIAYVRTLSAGG